MVNYKVFQFINLSGKYVIGDIVIPEINVVRKRIRKGLVRIAYVYPSIYEAMVSSLISHMIYYFINDKYPEVYVERFTAKKLYGDEVEPRSLETNTPLKFFELIITSIHYEASIATLIRLMKAAGIPVRRTLRKQVIIAGGPAIMANPHPYSDIIDAFIIGEAEDLLEKIVNLYLEYRDNKKLFLERLASLKSIYVPGIKKGITHRAYTRDLDSSYYPTIQFYDPDKEPAYGNGFIMESSRGCRFWCRFCLEGRLFKPYRPRSFMVMKNIINKGLLNTGLNRVVFYSLNFLFSRDEKAIAEYLCSNNIRYSFPSLRYEVVNDDMLELLKCSGQRTITLAPESFSKHVQYLIGKYDRVKALIDKLIQVINHGFRLKLYLISGMKGETLDDVRFNIESIRRIAKYAKEHGLKLTVTINPLVPKAKTMYQWIGMIDLNNAKRIIKYYKNELGGLVDTRPLYVNWAWIQASISLGTSELGRTLILWGYFGGDLGSWRRALKETGFNTSYAFNGYKYGDPLPWDNIRIGERVEELNAIEYLIWKRLTG